MKKLYWIETNAYDAIISDDGEIRRVLTDNNETNLYAVYGHLKSTYDTECVTVGLDWMTIKKVLCWQYLAEDVFDDSSWEEYTETVEELTADAEIIVEIEKEL